jgi:multiple sugar transport system substrate-binding protein
MSKKAWWIILIVIVVAIVGFSITGKKSDQAQTGKPQYVIKFWTFPLWSGITGTERDEYIEKYTKEHGHAPKPTEGPQYKLSDWPEHVAQEFMKEHPEVKIEVEMLNWGEGTKKIDIAVAAGQAPDIIYHSRNVMGRWMRRDLLEPVEEFMTEEDKKDFYPWALEAASMNGKVLFWPWLGTANTYIVNKTIFKERGIENLLPKDPERLWTYEELLQAAKAATYKSADGKQVYGMAIQFSDSTNYYRHPFIWGLGQDIFDKTGTKTNIASPKAIQGLKILRDFALKEKVMPPGIAGMQSQTIWELINSGLVAIFEGSNDTARSLMLAEKEGRIKPGTIELYPVAAPYAPPNQPGNFCTVGGFGVFKQKDAQKRKLAMEFARFLTNKTNGRAVKASHYFPTRQSIGNLYTDEPYMTFLGRTLKYNRLDMFSPYESDTQTIFQAMYQAIISGETPPKKAAQYAKKQFDEFIRQKQVEK